MNISNEIVMLLPIAMKVLVSTICGAIVGYERELKNKSAGLRTIILICVGSCLFTVASFAAAQYTGDPTRILSTIVTGIGFLGGGVIVQHEDKLIGITTAAFIWVVSAIGILCGLGLVITPILLTLGLVTMSTVLAKYERKIRKDDRD
jgi:putative Mg2+ transporter-C (MgtC) family protein